ncbi:LIP-domain-containing protein [Hortaea werneckii]|nr:LIP-domain-containing protein [Hortaea werneckii]
MFSLRSCLWLFLTALVAATPAIATPTLDRRLLLTPAYDPFYEPPAGFESEQPGTILRNRPVITSFVGLVPNPVDAYQLLYRTTAIDGSAIAEVTTVFVPANAKTDRFVSFQTAYDSADIVCNPSYNYRLGALQANIIAAFEELILEVYLALGYIVASSDYEGPDAAFGAGRLAGMGVLDNMRAVSSFEKLGLEDNPAIVGIGYSGGAIATGWAASLHSTYASELNIKGWASGGTPANLTGTTVFLDNTFNAGFLPTAIAGISTPSAYKAQLQPFLDNVLTSYGKYIIGAVRRLCAPGDLALFVDQSILSTEFQTEGYDILYQTPLRDVMEQNIMGQNANETPIAPVFLYHAIDDQVIPYQNASTLYDEWCGYGADVNFLTYESGGHFTTELVATVEQAKFVESAFAGTASTGCSRRTAADPTIDPLALGLDIEPILINLITALGNLGENDIKLKNDMTAINNTEGINT